MILENMVSKSVLKQLSPILWEIPTSYRPDMRVPARVYATEAMLTEISRDRSLDQLVNVATLPGIQKAAMVMPDVHEGYGFPIGGVAAMEYPDGVISPGGIGYDINCGVRLLLSKLTYNEARERLPSLAKELWKAIPSGVGKGGYFKLSRQDFEAVLVEGASWVVAHGYGEQSDLGHLESRGTIDWADPDKVSDRAKQRGRDQLGTMGAGNHFVEVNRVDTVFDEETAKVLGLFPEQVTILIHTGSRGLGHQVATDYIRLMMGVMNRYGIKLPDRELACVPFSAKEGKDYFAAMAAAANFAFANRQLMTDEVRQVWQRVFGRVAGELRTLYDVAHNIAKVEEYEIEGLKKKLIVHRKGATRAFPPGSIELVEEFRTVGQPVLIPGSMGTASYVLLGTQGAMEQSFGSTCHGAGRRMSRSQAMREINGAQLKHRLADEGIVIEAGSVKGIAEEAPQAYKDVDVVVDVVATAGIAKKLARLRPLAVIKG